MAARALMFGFLLTVAIPVAADPTLECDAAGSQVEIGACVTAMADGVQQALTASYGFAMQSAQELDRVTGRVAFAPALEASQSAWIAYRDAHCDAVGASFGGGSGTGIAITACKVDLGRARVDALMALAQ